MKKPMIVFIVSDTNEMSLDIAKTASRNSHGAVTVSDYLLSHYGQRTDGELTPTILSNVLCAERAKQYMTNADSSQYALPLYEESPVIIAPISAFYYNDVAEMMSNYTRANTRTVYVANEALPPSDRRLQFFKDTAVLDSLFSTTTPHIQDAATLLLDQIKSWVPRPNMAFITDDKPAFSATSSALLGVASQAMSAISKWRHTDSQANAEAVEVLTDALHNCNGHIAALTSREQHGILLGVYASGALSLSEFDALTAHQLPLEEVNETTQLYAHLQVALYTYQAEMDLIKPHTVAEHEALLVTHAQFYRTAGYEMPSPLRIAHENAQHRANQLPQQALEVEQHTTSHNSLNP